MFAHCALLLSWTLLPRAPASTQASDLTPPLEVVRVVDGDTLVVRRDGREDKLRLLSVDTEEKISGRPPLSPTKPETVFGEETALWARDLFASLADEDGVTRVRLRFPEGREERDVYGRLLCHVILPDGRDFNLLLVELGRSPYFNKYGNSRIAHDAFVRAQREARARSLGIWNPATNAPQTPGAPFVKRPYDRLLPWWNARAAAVEAFRRRSRAAQTPPLLAASEVEALEAYSSEAGEGAEVEVFGEIRRLHEEPGGALTVEFRSNARGRALRARLTAAERAGLEAFLRSACEELHQNYLTVRGTLRPGPRGPELVAATPDRWRLAGPQPRFPVEADAPPPPR